MTPDLAARKIIVAAYHYYVLDKPTMSDGEYDRLSNFVADNWLWLDPDRQWALGSPRAIRAGGSHIKFSTAAVGAACAAADIEFPKDYVWLRRESDRCRYRTCAPMAIEW